MNRHRLKAWMLLAALLGAGQAVAADVPAAAPGGISISPVRIDLLPQQHAAAITVTNAGAEEKLMQVEAMSWSHPQGSDAYAPSRELVVNPPLFRLPAGGSQVVRIGLARQVQPDPKTEKAFRLFFQELPGAAVAQASQLQMLLRIGVPVFVKPLQPAGASLQWKLVRAEEGKLKLQVHNSGGLHERVSNMKLEPAITVDGFAYILPGQDREWTLTQPQELPQKFTLHAVTEGDPVNAQLVLPPAP